MKINDLLPSNPTFTYWWQWHSDWDDVGIFDFSYKKYLCQASRSRTGKARFRTIEIGRDGSFKL